MLDPPQVSFYVYHIYCVPSYHLSYCCPPGHFLGDKQWHDKTSFMISVHFIELLNDQATQAVPFRDYCPFYLVFPQAINSCQMMPLEVLFQ